MSLSEQEQKEKGFKVFRMQTETMHYKIGKRQDKQMTL